MSLFMTPSASLHGMFKQDANQCLVTLCLGAYGDGRHQLLLQIAYPLALHMPAARTAVLTQQLLGLKG